MTNALIRQSKFTLEGIDLTSDLSELPECTRVYVIYNKNDRFVIANKKPVEKVVEYIKSGVTYYRQHPLFLINEKGHRIQGSVMDSINDPITEMALSGFLATNRKSVLKLACIGHFHNRGNKYSMPLKRLCWQQWFALKANLKTNNNFYSLTL